MATDAATRPRDFDSSVSFMQQEHAATLKALHEVIHKLQTKCTDLTFQLTMHGVDVEDEGDTDSRLVSLHDQLRTSQNTENSLKSELAENELKLKQLERDIRMEKKKHLDEMRNKAQTINSLKGDVEAKSNNIALLARELRRLKVEQKNDQRETAGDSGPACPAPSHHVPAPPKDIPTSLAHLRQRGSRTTIRPSAGQAAVSSSISVTEKDIVALAAVRKSGTDSLDISPFVQRDLGNEVRGAVVRVKKAAPLPPIAAVSVKVDGEEKEVHQVILSKQGKQMSGNSVAVSISPTTLAVDQLQGTSWKRLPETQTSEYN